MNCNKRMKLFLKLSIVQLSVLGLKLYSTVKNIRKTKKEIMNVNIQPRHPKFLIEVSHIFPHAVSCSL